MESHAQLLVFKQALIVLCAASLVIPLFHRLRISSVIGFILVGVAVGPFGLARLSPWMPWLGAITLGNVAAIQPIAEFGIVLLLFVIGLELSFERLWLMRRLVFVLGALQLAICAVLLAVVARLVGLPVAASVVIGLAGAMSSTAVGLQVLAEEKRLNTSVGRASFAILLFQDIAVLPVLVGLGLLSSTGQADGTEAAFRIALQALATVAAIVVLGRLALRPLFRGVARTNSPEVFMAASLLVVTAAALATAAAHLSMALGALIGGLLLAGTEYRRQVEVTIEPFKGLLVGVFLISIGMSLDLGVLAAHPLAILGAAVALVLIKLAVITPLARGFGLSWPAGREAGLLLGPGGEFGFVILTVAAAHGLLGREVTDRALVVVALTMTAIPLLARLGRRLTPSRAAAPIDPALLPPDDPTAGPRVIIGGFGRVGQTVAEMLEVHRIPYVAIDRDPELVARARRSSHTVYYGDIARIELLRLVGVDTARALVITLDDARAVGEVVAMARAERGDLLIIARARDSGHAAALYRAGASDAVPETIEASLQLSEAVLADVGVPMGPVIASIHEKRAALRARILDLAPGAAIRPLGEARLRDAAPPR